MAPGAHERKRESAGCSGKSAVVKEKAPRRKKGRWARWPQRRGSGTNMRCHQRRAENATIAMSGRDRMTGLTPRGRWTSVGGGRPKMVRRSSQLFPWTRMRAMDRDSITVANSALLAAVELLATRLVGIDWSRYFAAMRSSEASCRRLPLGPAACCL